MSKAARSPADQVRISGYRILHEVGRGGIATVYLAVQESLQREVVLKVMSPALTTDPNFTDRFMHEGRTIAQLNHPGIVTIYDISVDDFSHYIAMEYLQGGSLKRRIKEGMTLEQSLDVLYQVAAALEYAHEKRIVHRDVKPENIMFRDADGNEAVLTDFGIAKSNERLTQLTSAGMVVGTPRYMSPEQAEGKGATARSDIYALGIILYEMLTGLPPYHGKESLAVLYSHINDPIPQLPESCGFLQPLFEDMVAKNPSDRIASCTDLLERLEAFHDAPDGASASVPAIRGGRPSSSRSLFRGLGLLGRSLLWGGAAITAVVVISTVMWGVMNSPVAVVEDELPLGETPIIVAPKKIDLTRSSATATATADVSPADPMQNPPVDIGALLNLARRQLEANRLTRPAGNNALDTYRAVLKIEPGNADALRGVDGIADKYKQLAEDQLQAGLIDQAASLVSVGLSAQPEHEGLLALSRKIAAQSSSSEKSATGVRKNDQDPDRPIEKYVKELADDNYAEAQFQTALAFASGNGVEPDLNQTLYWLREAASRDHLGAQYNLALGLLFGPEPDLREAGRLMKALAEREYKPAYRVLGWMYTTGTGLQRRVKPAVRWSAKATTWGAPPVPDLVVETWQRAFEQRYEETVAQVSDEELRLPENLK